MSLLVIVTLFFIFLELANVFALYFKPGSTSFNAVGTFEAWEKSKSDSQIHDFVKYLVWWVAGTKLIFLSLLVVILVYADQTVQIVAVIALILSISTFYWKLFPLVRKIDNEGQLNPSNYSRTLGIMITTLILAFSIALILTILQIPPFV